MEYVCSSSIEKVPCFLWFSKKHLSLKDKLFINLMDFPIGYFLGKLVFSLSFLERWKINKYISRFR